ncbi:MAG: multifunctional oxoglutarate decarboxylase/oxoglutarate dehydrogenase thiamine pyrophosphate-binding subunit/dihydrolipoyllysine-residue succinyltransferase subunit, partial [Acidimicrobiia bacterium]
MADRSGPSGPNQWLIDEMYRRYVDNPGSVAEAWQDFFEGYTPQTDGKQAPEPAPPEAPPAAAPVVSEQQATLLKGADAALARHMEKSLEVPTATSVRTIPAKLLEVNRNIVNRYLQRTRGGKVSFTHLIGWAVVRALEKVPGMRNGYVLAEGKPARIVHERVNLGLAVDIRRDDGTRTLIVPNIKSVDTLDFAGYFSAYEDLIRKVHGTGSAGLKPDDLTGTTVTVTNPGMIGTVQSVPRLMSGQSAIIGVGTIAFPAEFQAADPEVLAQIGVSKVITITSTYDHRVIQGAESGEFLGWVHRLLLGEEAFYDDIFESLGVPYVPAKWIPDYNPLHGGAESSLEVHQKHGRVLQLINMYRVRGHLIANLDPLESKPPALHPELDPTTFGLSIWDLDRTFITAGLAGSREMTLGEILGVLRDAYCRTASAEYMHISTPDQKTWIQQRVEGVASVTSPDEQRHLLRKLNEAEAFETFMHQKYVGHKRFSLEGGESMIPMLDAILDGAADTGLHEVVIGMAHRGRLNVLANIIGKSYSQIFREFEGDIDPNTAQGSGDVKYHLGAEGKHKSRAGNEIAVSVASNPSHLESVDPVVEGMVRAKQDVLDRPLEFPVLPILIHGDAAFAGQGVVAETLNLSQLAGYRVGGTIHLVVNNQLGFTTGSDYGRSSRYATDVAKMVEAPIFHVNGDDPEACLRVSRLAFEFCQTFRKDVVIDMWCYRKWGHNEADEPSFTQPLMYDAIKSRRSVRKLYTERLVNRGDFAIEDAEATLEEFRSKLQKAFDETRQGSIPPVNVKRSTPIPAKRPIESGVPREVLDRVVEVLTTIPDGFDVHPK